MSDKEPGWYPDPDGENRQRYWDGNLWSEYYTPLAPAQTELHGAATAVADYPYLASTRAGAQQVMLSPTATGGWPSAPAEQGGNGNTLEFMGKGKRSSATRWAIGAGGVLVVGLVLALVIWLAGGLGPTDPTGGGGGGGGSTAAPTDGPTNSGTATAGQDTTGQVPAGGTWVGTLTLATATTVIFDVRADRDSDLRLSVQPEGGGDLIGGNDDRSPNVATVVGGSAIDPLLLLALDAGTYELVLDDRQGAATDFTLSIIDNAPELNLDDRTTVSTPPDGGWLGLLTIETEGDYVIDVQGITGSADPVLSMVGPTGRELFNDDRAEGDVAPLLEQRLTVGVWLVAVADFHFDPIEVTIEASAA